MSARHLALSQACGMTADQANALLAQLDEYGWEIRRKPEPRGAARKPADTVPAGLAFEMAHLAAKRACMAELGPRWHLVPGASQWISVPPKLRNYRFTRADGTQSVPIRNPRDYRAPAPRYWPGGTIPDGVTIA